MKAERSSEDNDGHQVRATIGLSEGSFRSEVTIKTLASPVVGGAGVIRSFEPKISGG
jgi:hypothetical protein